jgi:replicative DNA helicase
MYDPMSALQNINPKRESDFLTLCILAPEWVSDVSFLNAEDFSDSERGKMFAKLKAVIASGNTPNPNDYTGYAFPIVPPPLVRQHVTDYANEIARYSLSRRTLRYASEFAKAAHAVDMDTIRALARGADASLSLVANSKNNEVESAAIDLIEDIENPARIVNSLLRTGFIPLDNSLSGGIDKARHVVICGRPGSGKTAFICQLLEQVTSRKAVAAFWSLEMTTKQVLIRLACRLARVSWSNVRESKATKEELQRLTEAVKELQARKNLYIFSTVNRAPFTVEEVSNDIERIIREQGKFDVGAVDHLALMRDNEKNEVLRLGNITADLKQIANRFDTRMISLCQLNRASETRADPRPILSDLRNSGEIEENADMVIGIFRPKYYDHKADDNSAYLPMLKNRDGSLEPTQLVFLENIGSFERMAL